MTKKKISSKLDDLTSIQDQPPKKKRGRPFKQLNEDEVFKLASIGCTYEEMSNWFKVDQVTLLNNYSHIIKEGHAQMKQSVRRKQLQLALAGNGNCSMLIWLGKQILGQKDHPDFVNEAPKKVTLKKLVKEEVKKEDDGNRAEPS